MFLRRRKTSYQRRLRGALVRGRPFLLKTLADEWDEIQRTAKREALVERSKEVAAAMAKTLLVLAAFGGVLVVAATAPKMFTVLGKATGRRGYFGKESFKKAFQYLRKRKYIRVQKDGEEMTFRITREGELQALGMSYRGFTLKKPKRWDGLWRVVFFDIPERKKWERDGFRRQLERLGFYQMQESVFVSPFPCRQEIESLVNLLFIGAYVRFLETPLIAPADDLQRRFDV